MGFYQKGLEAPCKVGIVVPVGDAEEELLESMDGNVDSVRALVVRGPGIVNGVRGVTRFLTGSRMGWQDFYKTAVSSR